MRVCALASRSRSKRVLLAGSAARQLLEVPDHVRLIRVAGRVRELGERAEPAGVQRAEHVPETDDFPKLSRRIACEPHGGRGSVTGAPDARVRPLERRPPHGRRRMHPMQTNYVHGYSDRERERLVDQAATLTELLHGDTRYPPGARVLEAGCGVGAQTVTLASNSPGARFTCVDVSAESLDAARSRARAASLENVTFQQADIFALPFPDESFDHVFVCFVLEHLSSPGEALTSLVSRLRPGGTLTVIEGDHGSTFFHPDSAAARAAIQCLVDAPGASRRRRAHRAATVSAARRGRARRRRGLAADGLRGREPAGVGRGVHAEHVHGDGRGRARAGARGGARRARRRCGRGVAGLRRTAEPDGVFCYTFFKGIGVKRS